MCNLFHKNWKHHPFCACAVLGCMCNPCLKWFIIFRARAFYFYMQLSTFVVVLSSLNVWTWIIFISPMQSFGWVEGHPASNAFWTVLLPPQRLRLFPNPCGGICGEETCVSQGLMDVHHLNMCFDLSTKTIDRFPHACSWKKIYKAVSASPCFTNI